MTIPDAEISNVIRTAKQSGFSDRQIADITGTEESKIRTLRKKYGITPVIKRIDTMAGEFPAKTNYLFMTYHGDSSEYFGTDQKAEDRRQKANDRKQKTEKLKLSNEPPSSVIGLQSSTENFQSSSHKKRAIVLGCGPYAIGTSVEFDWCAVTAVATLRERGWESVVINCNPETVSTDYDTADILFFEELTFERVQDIYECVNAPFIISVGGQIPNSLAPRLAACDIPILGTTPVDIERAEDRGLFSALLDKIGVLQPSWTTAVSVDDVQKKAKDLGYPVLVRPSFVLSGKGMCIVTNDDELAYYLETLDPVVLERPLTISRFLARATECDVDGVAKDGKSIVMAISEHVESGGVHSGDSTLMLPAPTIPSAIQETLKMISKSIIAELHVTGPWNIQYLIVDDVPYVIECNLRASRSVPLVSKTLGINFIARATDALLGMDALPVTEKHITYTGVKAPQFSYRKLRGADPVPAIEMNSTGEVASFGRDQFEGYMSAYLSTGVSYPHKKGIFVSLGGKEMKIRFLSHVTALSKAGFSIYSTTGTALFLKEYGIPVTTVGKLYEGVDPTAEDLVKNGQIDAAIVIPERLGEEKKGRVIKGLSDGYQLRRLAIDRMIPLFTNDETAAMFVNSLIRYSPETIMIKSMREWRGSL